MILLWENIKKCGVHGFALFLGFLAMGGVVYTAWQVGSSKGDFLLGLQQALQWNEGMLLRLGFASLGILCLGAVLAGIRVLQQMADVRVKQEQGRRYISAIKQLGNLKEDHTANVEVRMGALYALENLMKNAADEYHYQVLSLLCAYLPANAELKSEEKGRLRIRADVHSCAQIIARRNRYWDEEKIYFNNLNFTGFLLEKADFEHSIMREMNFEHANLGETNFKHATIQRTNFRRTVLWRSNFKHAYISEANFESTMMRRSSFAETLIYKSNFQDVYLSEVELRKASIQETSFKSCSTLSKQQLLTTRDLENIILPNGDLLKNKEQLKYYQNDLSRKPGYTPASHSDDIEVVAPKVAVSSEPDQNLESLGQSNGNIWA